MIAISTDEFNRTTVGLGLMFAGNQLQTILCKHVRVTFDRQVR